MTLVRGLLLIGLSFLSSAALADLTAQDISAAEAFYRQGERSSAQYPAERFEGVAEKQLRQFARMSKQNLATADLQLAVLSALQFYALGATEREVIAMINHHEGYKYNPETVEWDLHYYALIQNDPLGGKDLTHPTYAFQLLKLIQDNPASDLVKQKAAQVEESFLSLLVKIALDQEQFSQLPGTQTRNIEAAVNLLDVLNTPKSIVALLAIAQGTPGRTEPTREFQFTVPRHELAHFYAIRALGNKAQRHSPLDFAKACGQILLGE